MSTDRLGKLLKAWRLAVENEGADHGEERAKREGEIREHIIGGGEAAPDPWPDTVRKASEAPDLDAAWRLLTDALRLPVVRSSGEWRNQPDPDPRDLARSCAVHRCGPIVGRSGGFERGGQVGEILPRPGAGCCGGPRRRRVERGTGVHADCG